MTEVEFEEDLVFLRLWCVSKSVTDRVSVLFVEMEEFGEGIVFEIFEKFEFEAMLFCGGVL